MDTHPLITTLENVLGRTLHCAPGHGNYPARNVMALVADPGGKKGHRAQYSLHADGSLAGLNLAWSGISDRKWQEIEQLAGEQLSTLEALNLRGNALTAAPFSGKPMPKLRFLDLCNNKLREFRLPPGMPVPDHLFLYGNDSLSTPPPEIVARGRFALHNYFTALAEQGEEIVYEAKMIILGDPGAGKTTLARKVEDHNAPAPDEEKDSTRGIVVKSIELTGGSPKFTMHIWDFGGQEVYHATHQFFLTKKSLYVLLCDGRKEEQFDYWLQVQEIYGQDSRLLLVVNQKGEMQPNLPMSDLRRDYPNLQEGKPTVINLLSDTVGTIALRGHIERSIRTLPQFERGEHVPRKWALIRSLLESQEEDHIGLREFRKICAAEGIDTREKQNYLLEFLHDLGVVLHFRDVAGLNQMVILKPSWATNAVYAVLDHTRKKGDNGHFTKKDLDAVWNCAEYEEYSLELLALMEKFELCYPAPESPVLYIVPSLLPDDPPENYKWTEPNGLQLHYQYTFMPKGIMSRLIVRQHSLLEQLPNMWKRGAVFQGEHGARVEVLESYRDKRISIRANGLDRYSKELVWKIASDIDSLNRSFHFNERMKVEQMIPCNCKRCREAKPPHFFSRSILDRAESANQPVQCQQSFEMVTVRSLLDGVFPSQEGKIDLGKVLELIEKGALKEALEMLKGEYPDAVNLLANLAAVEKEHQARRIDFDTWKQGMAQITNGILGLMR
jgi:internalin A